MKRAEGRIFRRGFLYSILPKHGLTRRQRFFNSGHRMGLRHRDQSDRTRGTARSGFSGSDTGLNGGKASGNDRQNQTPSMIWSVLTIEPSKRYPAS